VAKRKLAEAAYWSAVSHLFRGRTEAAAQLFKYGFGLNPAAMLVPPVGYLFKTQGSFGRIGAVIAEAIEQKAPRALARLRDDSPSAHSQGKP
jgi:hypothetical protein